MVVLAVGSKCFETAQQKFAGPDTNIFQINPGENLDSYLFLLAWENNWFYKNPEVLVYGFAGSNTLPIGTEAFATESYTVEPPIDPKPWYKPAALSRPPFPDAPELGVPCYTSKEFVTETDIKEPVMFDMVLANVIACGPLFSKVYSWRIISDNLSEKQFEEFKNRP